MDKEMMEKVNEFLTANGRRELSMDEMDKVVGGAGGTLINGVWMTEEQIFTLADFWVGQFGYGRRYVL